MHRPRARTGASDVLPERTRIAGARALAFVFARLRRRRSFRGGCVSGRGRRRRRREGRGAFDECRDGRTRELVRAAAHVIYLRASLSVQ